MRHIKKLGNYHILTELCSCRNLFYFVKYVYVSSVFFSTFNFLIDVFKI